MKLSPLTQARIRDGVELFRLPDGANADDYIRYVCHGCDKLHESEDSAAECCPPDIEAVWVHPDSGERFFDADALREALDCPAQGDTPCPVCHSKCKDTHDAANCCLWKDLDVAARFRIAQAVDAGAEWGEAIAKEAANAGT